MGLNDGGGLNLELADDLPAHIFEFLKIAGRISNQRQERLFVVGGRVRDLLLGRSGLDVDLVTEGSAPALAEILARKFNAGLTLHPRFQAATLLLEGFTVDIATARHELYPLPGSLPEISPGSLYDDLKRRDFSINAMAVSLNEDDFGRLIDPACGRLDLEQHKIRIMHENSFKDDATRIFRALRYEQRFNFSLEGRTLSLLEQHKAFLNTISPERIRYEFECIFSESIPEKPLARAGCLSVLGQMVSGLQFGSEECEWFEKARDACRPERPPDELYLALAGYRLSRQDAAAFIARLNLARNPRKVLVDAGRIQSKMARLSEPGTLPSEIYRLINPAGETAVQACLIAESCPVARKNLALYLDKLQFVKTELDGKDLTWLGVKPGPVTGRLLKTLLYARLDGKVASRQDEISLANSCIAAGD